MQSFLGIRLLNLFDNVPTIDILKKHIITFFRPQMKSIFGIHDPVGLRYLFQLRVGLSPLRSDKWCHKFSDAPSEICACNQEMEDTCHFLFSYPFFATRRATLATSVMHRLQHNKLPHLTGEPLWSSIIRKCLVSIIRKYLIVFTFNL